MEKGRLLIEKRAVTEFAEMRLRPVERRVRQPRGGFDGLANCVFDQLIDGDERGVRKLTDELVTDVVRLTNLIQEVLVPALLRIGNEWHAGRIAIWVEHQASAIIERILGAHHVAPRRRRRGSAAVTALSGDRHWLPSFMAASALRDDNWTVHHLGADLPADEIVRFCGQTTVDLVVLTVTTAENKAGADSTASERRKLKERTIIGGPGKTLYELQRLARAS